MIRVVTVFAVLALAACRPRECDGRCVLARDGGCVSSPVLCVSHCDGTYCPVGWTLVEDAGTSCEAVPLEIGCE